MKQGKSDDKAAMGGPSVATCPQWDIEPNKYVVKI